MKAALLAVLLGACAPAYSLATRKASPIWLHAVDMVAFSAGCVVGLNEYNTDRDPLLLWGGFGVAALAWGPYWFVRTSP